MEPNVEPSEPNNYPAELNVEPHKPNKGPVEPNVELEKPNEEFEMFECNIIKAAAAAAATAALVFLFNCHKRYVLSVI